MTDLEINKALALAIGWRASGVTTIGDETIIDTKNAIDRVKTKSGWVKGRLFDYRDPAVIWPIAVKYDCFPKAEFIGWTAGESSADTAAKAVALAVTDKSTT